MTEQIKIAQPKLNRIPGGATLPFVKEREIYLKPLHKYTVPELEEILDRQKHLLANKYFIFFRIYLIWHNHSHFHSNRFRLSKLPDKGERIKTCHANIAKELEARNEITTAAALFSQLNIAATGRPAMNQMEWTGKYQPNNETNAAAPLDSDDDPDDPDETDPLKILAQSRAVTKLVTVLPVEPTLITEADLAEVRSFAGPSPGVEDDNGELLEPHAIHMCDIEKRHDTSHSKFLPHRTTKSDSHSVAHEKARKMGKYWEVTAATPPLLRNAEAQLLTLQESISVQQHQKEALKVCVVVSLIRWNLI